MNRECMNIYKTARLATGQTREGASELLNVAPRTLAYYESERDDFKRPPGEIVDKMVEIYNAEWLAYMHGVLATETGKNNFPYVHTVNLAEGVLKFQSHLDRVLKQNIKMRDIAMDGRIDEAEQGEWELILEELLKLAEAAMNLGIGGQKKSPKEQELQRA